MVVPVTTTRIQDDALSTGKPIIDYDKRQTAANFPFSKDELRAWYIAVLMKRYEQRLALLSTEALSEIYEGW